MVIILFKFNLRQHLHKPHRFPTHIDNAQQQIHYIPGIAGFGGPIVGIVFDAAVFVDGDLVKPGSRWVSVFNGFQGIAAPFVGGGYPQLVSKFCGFKVFIRKILVPSVLLSPELSGKPSSLNKTTLDGYSISGFG